MSDVKTQAHELLKRQALCVISSIGPDDTPQSALVAFSVNDQFEIMIATSRKSRKFRNVTANPHVSVVFGPDNNATLQYEGKARILEGAELTERLDKYFARQPGSRKYQEDPEQAYILVEPSWMRLTANGPFIKGEEVRFDAS